MFPGIKNQNRQAPVPSRGPNAPSIKPKEDELPYIPTFEQFKEAHKEKLTIEQLKDVANQIKSATSATEYLIFDRIEFTEEQLNTLYQMLDDKGYSVDCVRSNLHVTQVNVNLKAL